MVVGRSAHRGRPDAGVRREECLYHKAEFTYYNNRVRIHHSAFKHGVTEDRIRHAYDRAVTIADLDPDSDPPKLLIIGADQSSNLLELIALLLAEDELLIIHAMPLRPTFHTLLPDPTEQS